MIRTDKGNVNTLSALKRVINLEISPYNQLTANFIHFRTKILLKQVPVEEITPHNKLTIIYIYIAGQ